ncbi:MAG: hypothetical protein UU87_C0006G0011 [Parcubacteria group bacterium GW2011_GWA2_42_11]|nr:MAG: hypothetical protein UU87_C0006G0011 [Parcubacteria group bacterium GW2011_GWA2_42_11]
MIENNKRAFYIVLVGILLISSVFFAFNYFFTYKELQEIESTGGKTELNNKVIDFASMFIKKVLQADKEVDFETRLSLENAVRDLKDEEIMSEWQNFVGSKTEAEAQNSVKKLLEILITKIRK